MATLNDVVKLGIDVYKGKVPAEFSATDPSVKLREALIEANGGSTKIDLRAIRDGRCKGLFTIIEILIDTLVVEGLTGSEFFNSFVDFKNLGVGDQNEFHTEDNSLFVVSTIADGTQGIRRQRLNAGSTMSVSTKIHSIKVYEELSRLLSGRVDFNTFVDRVSLSMTQQIYNDIYTAWSGITGTQIAGASSATYDLTTGSYDRATLLTLVGHVKAATGMAPVIYGTDIALAKIEIDDAKASDEAKNTKYNTGFYGKFYTTPLISVPQVHAIGTQNFKLADDKIYVMAAQDKFIKFVYEGDTYTDLSTASNSQDLTQNLLTFTKWGTGILCSAKFGRYDLA